MTSRLAKEYLNRYTTDTAMLKVNFTSGFDSLKDSGSLAHFLSKLCRFCQFCSRIFSKYTCNINTQYALKQTILNIKLREFGSAWHKITNILLFFEKFVIFGF